MPDGNSPYVSKAEKRRLHQQRREAIARRQRHRERPIASQRQAIPGVEHLQTTLKEIEFARAKLRGAEVSLGVLLGRAALAQAYAQFKDEGGISASDWQRWLNGESLGGIRHASKQHLRIVSVRDASSIPCRPIGSTRIVEEELAEDDATDLCAEEYYDNDGPEAA